MKPIIIFYNNTTQALDVILYLFSSVPLPGYFKWAMKTNGAGDDTPWQRQLGKSENAGDLKVRGLMSAQGRFQVKTEP